MSARSASVLFCIILCGAAFTDLRFRKVSNRWLLLGCLTGIILKGPRFLLPAFLMFFPVYLLFRLRLMGAGDGKLIMLIAGSLGLTHGLCAVFSGFVVAAFCSLIKIFRERSLAGRLSRLRAMASQLILTGKVEQSDRDMLCRRNNTIPLAACLSAGTIIYILLYDIKMWGGPYV